MRAMLLVPLIIPVLATSGSTQELLPEPFWVYYREFDQGPQKVAPFATGTLTAKVTDSAGIPQIEVGLVPVDNVPPGEWFVLKAASYQAAFKYGDDWSIVPATKVVFNPKVDSSCPPPNPNPAPSKGKAGTATPPSLTVTFQDSSLRGNQNSESFEIYLTCTRVNRDSGIAPPPGRTNLKVVGTLKWTVTDGKTVNPSVDFHCAGCGLLKMTADCFPVCRTGCRRPSAFAKTPVYDPSAAPPPGACSCLWTKP